MKAVAVFPKERAVRVIEHPEPKIENATDVKLRILDVGICGTDKEICQFEYGTPPDGSDYLIIGHESLGVVIETGPGVKTLAKGDLVVTMVRRPCDHAECVACRAGRQDFCYTGDFTERGIKQRHGYMTEFVVDDEKYMNKVPAELRDVAVLVEPLTIAEKAIMQIGQVQQRLPWACPAEPGKAQEFCHTCVVLGAGPVGLLGAMALIVEGFRTWVYSKTPVPNPRATLVEALGAKYLSTDQVPLEELAREVGNIDLVYEAVGASSFAFEVLKVLGTNGVFCFTGVPGRKAPIQVDTDLIMRDAVLKNQVIFGTVNASREAFQNAIADIAAFKKKWPEALKSLITGRYPIEQAPDLLLGKVQTKGEIIKSVITLST